MRAYHVTETGNVAAILSSGLEPRIGERSAWLGEALPVVWLFPDEESVENALLNWLGEWYEYESERGMGTELSLLVLDLPETMVDRREGSFEWACYDTIPPSMVAEVRHGY